MWLNPHDLKWLNLKRPLTTLAIVAKITKGSTLEKRILVIEKEVASKI